MKQSYNILICILLLFILYFIYKHNTFQEGFEDQENQKVPLNIFQTWHTKNLSVKMRECVDNMKKSNPEFKYHFYDLEECREFIKNHFENDVLVTYDSIIPYAFKADLWRYCILYIYGGVYLDIKYYNINNFKFIDFIDKDYYLRDIPGSGGGVANGMIISKPKNPKLWNCIQNIVKNVKEKSYGKSAFEVTGPMLLKREFDDQELENTKMFSIGEHECPTPTCLYYDNKPVLAMYKEYRDDQKSLKEDPSTNYFELWKTRHIFTD